MDSRKILLGAAVLIIAGVLYFVFVKDTSAPTQETTQSPQPTTISQQTVSGTYTGTLPCADCEGIDTSITFNEDMTYTMNSTYMGTATGNQTNTQNGTYEVTQGASFDPSATIITTDPGSENQTYYWVENETTIEQLSIDKEKVTNAPFNMKLTKTQ